MPRSPEDIKRAVARDYELWNAGDRDAWLDNARALTADWTLEDPVGTPAKKGLAALAEVWDRSRDELRRRTKVQYLILGGREAVAWTVSEGRAGGERMWTHAADCWRFDDGGGVTRRVFWEPQAEQLAYLGWSRATGEPVPPPPGMPTSGVTPVEPPETTRAEIRRGYELWNFGTKEEWLDYMTNRATDAVLEDPVGAPPKRGWHLLAEAWDHAPARHRLRVIPEHIIVCGRESAVLSMNAGTVQDRPMLMVSIDFTRMNEDGSRLSRTFWEPPQQGLAYADWSAVTGSA